MHSQSKIKKRINFIEKKCTHVQDSSIDLLLQFVLDNKYGEVLYRPSRGKVKRRSARICAAGMFYFF